MSEMKRMRRSIALAALAACVAWPAEAQEPSALAPGARVRVAALGFITPVTGSVVRVSGDSIWLLTKPDGSVLGVPLAALRRVEVSRGPNTRGRTAARRAGAGLLIGGTIGAVLGAATYDPGAFIGPHDRGGNALVGGAVFGALGALGGALYGLAAPGERWTLVRLPLARGGG
jgi:hypothetical protein